MPSWGQESLRVPAVLRLVNATLDLTQRAISSFVVLEFWGAGWLSVCVSVCQRESIVGSKGFLLFVLFLEFPRCWRFACTACLACHKLSWGPSLRLHDAQAVAGSRTLAPAAAKRRRGESWAFLRVASGLRRRRCAMNHVKCQEEENQPHTEGKGDTCSHQKATSLPARRSSAPRSCHPQCRQSACAWQQRRCLPRSRSPSDAASKAAPPSRYGSCHA